MNEGLIANSKSKGRKQQHVSFARPAELSAIKLQVSAYGAIDDPSREPKTYQPQPNL